MARVNQVDMDLRKIRRLLRETTRLAERASMTGSLAGGVRIAVRQYNSIRNHLQDQGVIPDDLFQELDEDDATFDELGVVAGMLDSYLEDDESTHPDGERPGDEEKASRQARRDRRRNRWGWAGWDWGGNWDGDGNSEAARFWNDPEALRDLQQMGETLREHLPELLRMRDRMKNTPVHPAAPFAPPAPASTGSPIPVRDAPETEKTAVERVDLPGASMPTTEYLLTRIRQISHELQEESVDYSRRMELSRELGDLLQQA